MWRSAIAITIGVLCGVGLGMAVKKVHTILCGYFTVFTALAIPITSFSLSSNKYVLVTHPSKLADLYWWIGLTSMYAILGLAAFFIAFYIVTRWGGWWRWFKQKTSAAKEKLLAKVKEFAPSPKPALVPV
jgi:hypothetical protein